MLIEYSYLGAIISKKIKESMNMDAKRINEDLQILQKKWYSGLSGDYQDTSKFSSPFCFGISEQTIKERDEGKPLLMYVGEEARNWWFDEYPIDYQKIQSWAITYFETQIFPNLTGNSNMGANISLSSLNDADGESAKEKNNSAFWDFLNKLHNTNQYAVCWNNLDKLHRVIWNEQKAKEDKRETKTLTYKQEQELHYKFGPENQTHSLLWYEISLLRPKYILFMGAKYDRSIEWALLNKGALANKKRPNINSEDELVIELTEEFEECFGANYQPEVFWICHPGWLQRNKTADKVLNKLKEMIKNPT